MEFSGLYFLYAVLPLILLAYFLMPDVGRRNTLLIAVSLLIYAMCQPLYVLVLLLLCRMNFQMARRIRKGDSATVILPVVVNLAALFLLKYLDPILLMAGIGTKTDGVLGGLVGQTVDAMNGAGMSLRKPVSLAPLGISFYTLTALSYLFDIFRGKHPAERSFKSFLLHMVFFPKLFQGPLVRYEQIAPQLKERRESYRHIFEGALRFCTGLAKKVLLADYCGRMIGELVSVKSDQTLVGSWLGAVLFLFQIYYDFSGCCDMAVGLGKVFGFRFPENFNLPFTAMSVTEFCQRWNLTLGNFFKDYVYTPLLGKREGSVNRFAALLVTMVLVGLWHGASFNFLMLGLFFCAVFVFEEQFEGFLTDLPYWLRHVLTVLVLLLSTVIFQNRDVESLGNALKAMIGNGGVGVTGDGQRVLNCVPLIAACWIGVTSGPKRLRLFWRRFCGVGVKQGERNPYLMYVYVASCFAFMVLMLWWCTVSRMGSPVQPSIFLNL